jgi:tight adherence protein C
MPAPTLVWILGGAWGLLVASPFVRAARRAATTARIATLAPPDHDSRSTRARRSRALVDAFVARTRVGPVARVLGAVRDRRRARVVDALLARDLPVVIDLLGVAVGAGCTPYLAVEVAATWSPPAVAASLSTVLRACALGVSFDDALSDAVSAVPRLRPLGDALLAAERLGSPVAPVLARLAAEERTALRRRAEAHARRIPVRLLFPLVFLVLPAFVILTVVPGIAAGLGRL